jgi:hypothetical protein
LEEGLGEIKKPLTSKQVSPIVQPSISNFEADAEKS